MPRSSPPAWPALVLLLAAPSAAAAQADAVPERTLAGPDAEFAESFDQVQVGALRELPGGRVLLVDLGPKTLLLADFASGHETTIGRNGQGPGEYQFPGALIPYLGDTTLLVDRISRRFLTVTPDGKLGRVVPFPDQLQGFAEPRGADRKGRIYFQASPFGGGPGGFPAQLPDSTAVLRWDPAGNRLDTLTRVKIPDTKMQVSGGQNSRMVMIRPQPFAAEDDWGVAPDGRVGVARVGDYHVEWLGERPARGAPVRYDRVKVREADKEQFLSTMRNSRNRITVTSGGPGRGPEPKPPEAQATDFQWPDYKPPFPGRSALVSPEGQLWLPRSTGAGDDTPSYDVFDGNGNLAARVFLPKGRKAIGLGQGTLYAVRTDDDGLQWLERYRR